MAGVSLETAAGWHRSTWRQRLNDGACAAARGDQASWPQAGTQSGSRHVAGAGRPWCSRFRTGTRSARPTDHSPAAALSETGRAGPSSPYRPGRSPRDSPRYASRSSCQHRPAAPPGGQQAGCSQRTGKERTSGRQAKVTHPGPALLGRRCMSRHLRMACGPSLRRVDNRVPRNRLGASNVPGGRPTRRREQG
jgi:hypothetical protein